MSFAARAGQLTVILIVTVVGWCAIARLKEPRRHRRSLLERYREFHQP